jgi:hypothetical protein
VKQDSKNNNQPISQDSIHPEGFLAVNRTIFDHVRSGKLHPTAFGMYTFILQECDWGTGVWWGSAHRLVEDFGHTAELRTIRDNLARLFKLGFLKSLRRKGRRGNYFVLINKYRPTVGVLRGYELNADESIDLQTLVYNSRSEDGVTLYCRCSDGAVTVHRRCSDGAPYQDIQDVQASQNGQATTTSTAGDDAADVPRDSKTLTAKEQFMEALAAEFSGEHTTPKHRDEAWEKATEVGPDLFLAALKVWQNQHEETDTFLGETDGKQKSRSWPLRCFLDSMYFADCVRQAETYLKRGILRDELHVFLDAYVDELTPERVVKIRKCGDDWPGGRLWAIRALNQCQKPEDYADFDRDPLALAQACKAGKSPAERRAIERDRQAAKDLNDACRAARESKGPSFDELLSSVQDAANG